MDRRKRPMTRTQLILQNAADIIQQRKNEQTAVSTSPLRRSTRARTANRKLDDALFLFWPRTSTPKRQKLVSIIEALQQTLTKAV